MVSIQRFSLSYRHRRGLACALLLIASCTTAVASAQPATAAAKPTSPYSLPWQLRPAAIATVLRSDTTLALYENPTSGASGSTVASMLLGSFKLTADFAPLVRVGVVSNDPPDGSRTAAGATLSEQASFINPLLGGTYLFKLSPSFRLAAFVGFTLPVGDGGGESPGRSTVAANAAGILARSAMDNAMFAVDYFTVLPGLDIAYVAHGLTVQLEATLLRLWRVSSTEMLQPDDSRTNFTAGLHVGYFVIPQLSIGAELRHQRWLSTPVTVSRDSSLRDTTTIAAGLRAHLKLSETAWIRPGIAYARGLDDPMSAREYNVIQLDVPVSF
jgi:hypothetical protein